MISSKTAAPQILHVLPGRLRVHLPGWSGNGRHLLEARLCRLPGVRRAEANPLTRNLLLCFDPQQTTQETLLAALAEMAVDAPAADAQGVHDSPDLGPWVRAGFR